MLNSYRNNNDKKNNMRSPRFEPRIYGFKNIRDIHYAVEANGSEL